MWKNLWIVGMIALAGCANAAQNLANGNQNAGNLACTANEDVTTLQGIQADIQQAIGVLALPANALLGAAASSDATVCQGLHGVTIQPSPSIPQPAKPASTP